MDISISKNNSIADGVPSRSSEKDCYTEGENPFLVTNTEFASPCEKKNVLKPLSLQAFSELSPRSKRYVLQGVIKEILHACELPTIDENGAKIRTKYYRLGACKQLSSVFNPNNWSLSQREYYDLMRHHGDEIQENVSMASIRCRDKDDGVEAHLSGLCRCDSVWICPVCGPTVAEYRAKEVAQALYLHQKDDGWVVFVTFTVRHTHCHSVTDTLTCVRESLRSLKSGKTWAAFKDRHGFIGSIRAPEYTYTSSNGHHPHVHELWFLDRKPDLKAMKRWVFDRYSKFVVKHDGFKAPSFKRGVDMRLCLASHQKADSDSLGFDVDNEDSISKYISKGADTDKTLEEALKNRDWGAPEELTKGHLKKSINTANGLIIDSYNPTSLALHYMSAQYDLYESLNVPGKESFETLNRKRVAMFKELYRGYADAFFGKAQLYWSRGLKDRFRISEIQDNEINDAFEEGLRELMFLEIEDLQKIVKRRLRADVLNIVEDSKYKNDAERKQAVRYFLDESFVSHRYG